MHENTRLILATLGLAVFVSLAGSSSVAAAPQAQGKSQAQPALTAKGELQSVDSAKKMFTISTEGKSLSFMFNDRTKVTGAQGGAAGLATMSGHEVTVIYALQGQDRVATSIEVSAEQQK